uniref:Rhodanese domain-containing protein n=1 Tax=Parascaris equorum TaxID=6256 RepID=A0A914SI79_PAREQ
MSGGFNDKYRLIDCTSRTGLRSNHKEYKELFYGKFDQLIAAETRQKKEYMKCHIPEAVHMDFHIATYPSEYSPCALYPPRIFQHYARLLGINIDHHLIFYGRGALSGMLVPSAIAWIFKCYGHDRVSVLDGGFRCWEHEIGEVTDRLPTIKHGNWKASDIRKNRAVTFDELIARDASGLNLFDKIDAVIFVSLQVNFLDARIRGQFEGTEPTGLDHHRIEECGFEKGKPIITSCNRGVQASLLAMVLEYVDETLKPRVYHGSLKELQVRDPERISS